MREDRNGAIRQVLLDAHCCDQECKQAPARLMGQERSRAPLMPPARHQGRLRPCQSAECAPVMQPMRQPYPHQPMHPTARCDLRMQISPCDCFSLDDKFNHCGDIVRQPEVTRSKSIKDWRSAHNHKSYVVSDEDVLAMTMRSNPERIGNHWKKAVAKIGQEGRAILPGMPVRRMEAAVASSTELAAA